jgi:DNA-binding MarR family transcriptional regulator
MTACCQCIEDEMTRDQKLLSALAKTVFRLNGQFLAIGEELARPAGLTAAQWQVLGAVLESPRSVADIGRETGVTRQSVQRIADLLVDRRLADYRPNPAHRRAKLLTPTIEGRQAIRRIRPHHAAFAERLAEELSSETLEDAAAAVERVSKTLDELRGLRSTLPAVQFPTGDVQILTTERQ